MRRRSRSWWISVPPVPELTYSASSGEFDASLAQPRGPGPWPGVVVIQDALGLNDDIREQADRVDRSIMSDAWVEWERSKGDKKRSRQKAKDSAKGGAL